MTEHPRSRRNPFGSPRDAAAALSDAADQLRADQLHRGNGDRPADDPPTGLLDLAAIRAALGQDAGGEVNPAAVAWLAGQELPELPNVHTSEPPSFEEWLADPEPAPVEHPCGVLGNAYHSDAPCGPQHHPTSGRTAEVPDESVPVPEPLPVPRSPEPAPEPAVAPPAPAPVFQPVRQAEVEQRAAAEKAQTVRAFRSDQRRLTWRSRHDERSRAFPVRGLMRGSAPLTDHVWPVGPVLDQQAEGACVGFAIVDAVNAQGTTGPDGGAEQALALYRRAQQLDSVPGESYAGTSVLAGMQAGREAGLLGGYRWCFGTRDVAQAVLQTGPVVVGIPWPQEWFDIGGDGLLQLPPGGGGELGHCLAVVGLTVAGPAGEPGPWFVLQNSYGPDWGDRGFGHVHHRTLASLLHGTGEAAVPVAAGS